MNQKEKEILKLEQDIRDTLENELISQQTENKIVRIKDIKLVGQIDWEDKVNGKDLSNNLFLVEKEIIERDEIGEERKTEQINYYLGDKCIGGALGDNQVIFRQDFEISEPDKASAIKDLLDRTPEETIEKNSLSHLEKKEMTEVLSAHLGRKVSEEEVEKMLEDMDKEEVEELEKEKKEKEDKNSLSEKQADKIKVNGIQKADLNKKVDGKETLGKRLDLEGYDTLYIVYSEKVNEVTAGSKVNNTTYSLVGMTKDGEAKVLNDEFEMDKSSGNSGSRQSTKIRADSTASRDNNDVSVYTRKSNGASIGCENNQGYVNMFLYQKTKEENENIGIQIETNSTPVIPVETREIMNRNKGVYQKEKVQDEIEEHTEEECIPKDIKDYDGIDETSTHIHLSEGEIDEYVTEIMNYENNYGEEKIKEVFSENDVRDKLLREIQENEGKISLEQIIENVKEEMNADAEMYPTREHRI